MKNNLDKVTIEKEVYRNELGQFIKGRKLPKRLEKKRIKNHLKTTYRENAPWWKGGTRVTARKIAIESGKNMNECTICKKKGKMLVHHCNYNINDNRPFNLGIVCDYCHNAIHDTIKRRNTRFKVGHLPYTNQMPI